MMTKYFKPAYITAKYTDVTTVKAALTACTTLNSAVIVYNNFYKQVLLEFADDASYLDVKYKTAVST